MAHNPPSAPTDHSPFTTQHSALSTQHFSIRSLLFLTIFCLFLFGYRVADRDLWSSHEGRAAQDAQTILDENRWGLPGQFDRRLELQKPPLYYWLVAVTARLRGQPVDACAVRLPAVLAGTGGVLGLFWLGWRRHRPIAGLTAALILATAVHYTWLARTGRIDMPLTLAVGGALGCFYLGQCRQREREGQGAWRWYLPAYLAVAFAVLLKGPIGVILPAAVAGVYLGLEKQLPLPWQVRRWGKLIHQLGLWWGAPLMLGFSAPWFVWADLQTGGGLVQKFFWYHNVKRFWGEDGLRARPWYLYGPYLAGYLLPWSLLLPVAVWSYFRRARPERDAEGRFGLVWLVTMVVVLSCAGFKRADYLLPAFPGAAFFLGCTAERWYLASARRRRWAGALAVVLGGCLAGWWVHVTYVLPAREPTLEYQRFAAEVRQRAPTPELVLFFRAEAHALAFHIGAPIDTFLEWENLDIWAGRPGRHYIVMPAECAVEWPRHVTAGRLEEVCRSTDLPGAKHRDRPLVLMRTRPAH